MNKYLPLLLLVLLALSCKKHHSVPQKTHNPQYLWIQGKDTNQSKKILIVSIDAHADAHLAVNAFKSVVKRYNCTVIGLKNVQNNQSDFLEKITADINDAIKHLRLKPKYLFLAGFSGGARMAYYYGLNYPRQVSGVIMNGAGFDFGQLPSFPVVTIIGTKDFNFSEQFYLPSSNLIYNRKILTLIFDGGHQWADTSLFALATTYLFYYKQLTKSPDLQVFSRSADDFVKQGKYFFALKQYEMMYKFNPDDLNKNQLENFVKSDDLQNYLTKFSEILNQEKQTQKIYVNELYTKDLQFWKNEIRQLNKKITETTGLQSDSYARLKAYLGIVLYSLTKRELQNPNSPYIDKFLAIYEILDPQNNDLKHFKQVRQTQIHKN